MPPGPSCSSRSSPRSLLRCHLSLWRLSRKNAFGADAAAQPHAHARPDDEPDESSGADESAAAGSGLPDAAGADSAPKSLSDLTLLSLRSDNHIPKIVQEQLRKKKYVFPSGEKVELKSSQFHFDTF